MNAGTGPAALNGTPDYCLGPFVFEYSFKGEVGRGCIFRIRCENKLTSDFNVLCRNVLPAFCFSFGMLNENDVIFFPLMLGLAMKTTGTHLTEWRNTHVECM